MYPAEVEGCPEEIFSSHQSGTHSADVGKRFFVTDNRLFIPQAADTFLRPCQVSGCQDCLCRQWIQQQGVGTVAFIHFRHDIDTLQFLFGKLGFHIERTDCLHFLSEEVDTVRKFIGEREYVQDTAAQGILPRFVDIVHLFESIFVEHVGHEHIIQLLADTDL